MKQLIQAHRGASGVAPENTRMSFGVAAAFGFDGVEFDVHLTKDKELVICHDETIDRTSDMTGQIQDLTLKELRQANFAAKHSLKAIKKETIMTLDEFFTEFKDKFKVINIEMKTDNIHYVGIEQAIYNVVQKHKAFDQVMFSAFNFDSIRIMHKIDPNVELAFLWESSEQWAKIDNDEIKTLCTYLNPMWSLYMENKVEYESLGLMFNCWTVRELKIHQEMKANNRVYCQISNFMF